MKEFFLIDGYNYLHYLRRAGSVREEGGLPSLIATLERYAAFVGGEVGVVLDGTRWKDRVVSSKLLQVHCTEPGVTADAYCERWMSRVAEARRRSWMLVSDDRALGLMAVGLGVRWVHCGWFAKEIQSRQKDPTGSIESGRMKRGSSAAPFNTPFEKL